MLRVVWICLAVSVARAVDQPPGFPSDFKVDVQITTWLKKGVRSFTVAFTAKGNGRGNALYIAETSGAVEYQKLLDFENNVFIESSSSNESCKYSRGVPEAERTGLLPVGFVSKDGKVEFLTPDTLFLFSGEKTFVAQNAAGLSLWTLTADFEGTPCNVSFYWTTNGTQTPRCDRSSENHGACPPIPVSSEINCNGNLATYTFSSYTENLDYTIFQEPLGFYCNGRDTIPYLPELPDVFSLRAENILRESSDRAWYSYLWVDIENNAVATRNRKEGIDVIVVSDYQAGFDYEIDVATGTCVPKATDGNPFVPESKNELVWGEAVPTDIQHSGDHQCRLSKCHVYATFNDYRVQNLYYAYDNVTGEARRPAYMETRDKGELRRQRHIVAYDENVRYWDVFDLYRCFHQEDIRLLSITLEGNANFDKDIESLHDLREAYRKAVINALGLSQTLRFTTFWIVPNRDRTGMSITGFVYPAREENGFEDIDTDTAIENLKSLVSQGNFSFQVKSSFGPDSLTYKAVSVAHGPRVSGGVAQAQAPQGYTTGNMAGLGFGMLFLGIALTLATFFVVSRVFPRNQFSAILLKNFDS